MVWDPWLTGLTLSQSRGPDCASVDSDQTGLNLPVNPVEEDFEIPFDILCDNPSPYFDARISTIGALFITYDSNWNDKLLGWMEDAEKRGKLVNKNGSVTCPPFSLSSCGGETEQTHDKAP